MKEIIITAIIGAIAVSLGCLYEVGSNCPIIKMALVGAVIGFVVGLIFWIILKKYR